MSDLRKALEQAIEALDSDNPELQLRAVIKVLVEMSASAEREACAKLVEADGLARGSEGLVLIKAAGRIRARGVDTVNTNQKRVDETAKREHKWVGLTDREAQKFYNKYKNREELIYAIDEFLEEKNT